jgi:hypothetical protein
MTAEIPWFMKSPSPWTLIIWGILAVWASRILVKRVSYRRARLAWLLAFVDSALILGFLVLVTDLFWCVACGLRFGLYFPFYPDVYGLILSAARDAAGMIFLGLLVWDNFRQKIVSFSRLTYLVLIGYVFFLAAWFGLAPDPSFVDWNYAFKYGYPAVRILQDFLISHVVGRSFIVVLFYSVFRRPSGPALSAAFRPGLAAQKCQIFPSVPASKNIFLQSEQKVLRVIKREKGNVGSTRANVGAATSWSEQRAAGPAGNTSARSGGFFIMPSLGKEPVGGCINYLQAEIVQDRRQDPDGQDPRPRHKKCSCRRQACGEYDQPDTDHDFMGRGH